MNNTIGGTLYVLNIINGSGLHTQVFTTRNKFLENVRNTFKEEAKVYAERMGIDNDFDIEKSVNSLLMDGFVSPEFTADDYYMSIVELH